MIQFRLCNSIVSAFQEKTMSEDFFMSGDDYYDDDDEDTQKDKYLTFKVGEEEYGVEISCVIEVIGMQKITHVPDMPEFVKGVINLRGQVIPITDVRMRFNIETREYNDRTCIVVVTVNDTFVGLVVDTVSDVLAIPQENIDPPPKVNQQRKSHFIQGIGKIGDNVKILLDVNKLLYDDELEKIASVE